MTTYLLEELDAPTRDYLLAVRDRHGEGMPGAFAPVANPLPAVGCGCGLFVLIATFGLTLTNAVDVVYDDPDRVALLQTAGILLGGWLVTAALRVWAKKGSRKFAGHWVYADPLHVYQAAGAYVTVIPLADVTNAQVSHNVNDKKQYTNSTVTLAVAGRKPHTITVEGQTPAEQFVRFLNYVAWARGPEGGPRATLPPEKLGTLAAHVARTDDEPHDAEGNPLLDLVPADWEGEIPAEPERVRRAVPSLLPYAVMLFAGAGCFFLVREVNIPIRDDAIYEAVTKDPVEPRYLRDYLRDPRNTRHRDAVSAKLAAFYDPVILKLRERAGGPLRDGFVKLLESLRTAELPVVSVRVTEAKSPAGAEGGKDAREAKLRTGLADRVAKDLTPLSLPITIPPGVNIVPPPPPVGEQLIAFAQAPADAPNAHLDIRYSFEPGKDGGYRVSGRVELRVSVDDPPVATQEVTLPRSYRADEADAAVGELTDRVVEALFGTAPKLPVNIPGLMIPGPPKIQLPKPGD